MTKEWSGQEVSLPTRGTVGLGQRARCLHACLVDMALAFADGAAFVLEYVRWIRKCVIFYSRYSLL